MEVRNLEDFRKKVLESPNKRQEFINNPVQFMEGLEEKRSIWSNKVFLAVVIFVGTALLASIIISGIIVLRPGTVVEGPTGSPTILKPEIDNFFVMIASSSIGALTGMLIPNPKD